MISANSESMWRNISRPVLIVQRQQDLAVAVGLELVAAALEDLFLKAEAVQLAVAHHTVGTAVEGLHAFRRQAHDG